ncbi:MAG: IS3 family transposase [Rubrobacteridae bacterium]|nr:IS3 family transposase [Rubrobacteridae bacterium]
MNLVQAYMGQYGLNRCLSVLGVAKSTYYYQLNKDEPLSKYEYLKKTIIKIIEKNPAYGYRRIRVELLSIGIALNHKPLQKLLKAWGLTLNRKIKHKKKSGIAQILGDLKERVNLVLNIGAPSLFGVVFSDITEIRYCCGKVYLAASLEAASRRIVGYDVSKSPDTDLVIKVCRQAKAYLKKMGADLFNVIFHQDQGSVYTSYGYVGELVRDGSKVSYSRAGTPSDNPEMESFFGRLKDEWADVFAAAQSESEVVDLIDKAISYYNKKRRHSALDYLAPDDFIKRELALVSA